MKITLSELRQLVRNEVRKSQLNEFVVDSIDTKNIQKEIATIAKQIGITENELVIAINNTDKYQILNSNLNKEVKKALSTIGRTKEQLIAQLGFSNEIFEGKAKYQRSRSRTTVADFLRRKGLLDRNQKHYYSDQEIIAQNFNFVNKTFGNLTTLPLISALTAVVALKLGVQKDNVLLEHLLSFVNQLFSGTAAFMGTDKTNIIGIFFLLSVLAMIKIATAAAAHVSTHIADEEINRF